MPKRADLLTRLRAVMVSYDGTAPDVEIVEKPMVGGRSFTVNGRLCCGVTKAGLMVRVDPATRAAALAEPHVHPLTIGAREPLGFVVVDEAGLQTQGALQGWVRRGFGAVLGSTSPPRDAFAALAERFETVPDVTLPGEDARSGFGADALRVNGSIFAMLTRGQLVVKLPRARVAELIAAGHGEPFTAGKSSPVKEWLTVVGDDPDVWFARAQEALAFVRDTRPATARKSTR